MHLSNLYGLAIKPTSWPRDARGYREFTEHAAVTSDVGKALTSELNFDQAALKAWFAAGYLLALSGKSPETPATHRRPESNDLPTLHHLLLWLGPIHDGARDNSDIVDTATVARTFQAHAQATLIGLQFQPIAPAINRDGVMLQPDPASIHQSLPTSEVITRSTTAHERIYGPSLWLGHRHCKASSSRLSWISRQIRRH